MVVILLVLEALLVNGFVSRAQAPDTLAREDSSLDSIDIRISHVTYPVDAHFAVSKTDLKQTFLFNNASLERIGSVFNAIRKRPTRKLTGIRIISGASPEGPLHLNLQLSDNRADALRKYILNLDKTLEDSLFTIRSLGENYEGLTELLAQSDQPWKNDAMDIITRTYPFEFDGRYYSSERKDRLKSLDGGKAWEYMTKEWFPLLRRARVEFEYDVELFPDLSNTIPYAPAPYWRGNLAPRTKYKYPEPDRWAERTIFAVKTNLLYDAAWAFNYGLELPLSERFSLCWEHYFPWWVFRDNRTSLQYLSLGAEARWWFLPQPREATPTRAVRDALVGHYIGLYGRWLKTDLQWDLLGCYQCVPVVSAGLTYGYAFPIAKHLNMEFSLSVGYARIPYQHYTPSEDWQILWRDRNDVGVLHYFGPTQLQITLVRPILSRYKVR